MVFITCDFKPFIFVIKSMEIVVTILIALLFLCLIFLKEKLALD